MFRRMTTSHAILTADRQDIARQSDLKAISEQLDARFTVLERHLSAIDGHFASINSEFREIEARHSLSETRNRELARKKSTDRIRRLQWFAVGFAIFANGSTVGTLAVRLWS